MQQHSAGAGFWDDPKEAEAYLKKMAGVKFWTDAYDGIKKMDEDLEVLLEFAKEDEAAQKERSRIWNCAICSARKETISGQS